MPFSSHHCFMVRPLACCALISSDHSCKRTACLIVAISVVLFCIMIPPVFTGLQFTTWSFLEFFGMSNLLRQVSWSLLYIIGQREGRRGIFYSYLTKVCHGDTLILFLLFPRTYYLALTHQQFRRTEP